MTRDEQSELLQIASTIIAQHIPALGYRVPQSEETMQLAGILRDGQDSHAIDMLNPALRSQFEDMLGDACHFVGMAFRRAVGEPIEDEEPDTQEEPGDETNDEDNEQGDD